MRINTKATNLELTAALKNYVDQKISSLEKYLKRDNEHTLVEVELVKNTNHHNKGDIFRAELNINLGKGRLVREEATDSDLYAAIDEVKDKGGEAIRTFLNKRGSLLKRSGRLLKKLLRQEIND